MTRSTSVRPALLVSLLMLGGCTESRPEADAAEVSGQELTALMADSFCRGRVACCPGGAPEARIQECADAFSQLFLEPIVDATDRGWVQYDPDQGAICAAALRQGRETQCDESPPEPDSTACADVWVGLQGEGEPCQGKEVFPLSSGRLRLACQAGLDCDVLQGGSESAVCFTPLAEGEPCGEGLTPCAPDLDCRHDENDQRVCQPERMIGDPCSGFGECARGYCDTERGLCVPEDEEDAVVCPSER